MTENPECCRIVLALDISPRSHAALELAAALATELDAELAGLFVEDADLLHLGSLPFAREIGLFSPVPRPLDVEQLELAFHREAEQVRSLLVKAAVQARLRWSFQVARGRIASALFALAAAPDLVVLGKRPRLGARPLGAMLGYVPKPAIGRGPVVAVYDGSPSGRHALNLAARMAHANGVELCLLLPAANDEAFLQLASEAAVQLKGAGSACSRLLSDDITEIAAASRHLNASVLVLTGDGRLRGGSGFATLLNDVDCPVLLVG